VTATDQAHASAAGTGTGSAGPDSAGPASETPSNDRLAAGSLPPAGRRGATVIPEAVVARITGQAAREAVARHSAPPGEPAGPPRAKASLHEGAARLDVTADLPYPVDIARAGEEIREYVRDRVAHLTGLRIDHVGFTVGRLVPEERHGRVH
jgi:hypothetical protein